MSHSEQDDVSASLIEELDGLCSSPSGGSIFRIDDQFRRVNWKSYEPEIIAIGPYHHRKENLKMMEQYKIRYLRSLIERERKDISTFVASFRTLEPEIRACYAERLSQNEDQLIKMMVVDGCFIIELLRKFSDPSLREEDDRVFRMNWMLTSLQRDLLLFENQLPFFVLCKLYDLIQGENRHVKLVDDAMLFFNNILPGKGNRQFVNGDLKNNYTHLLGLVHDEWLPSFNRASLHGHSENMEERVKWEFIGRATELREAGIKIQKVEGKLFDIDFENKTLKIPPLTIEDRTESILRNLIAYEQYDEYYPHFNFVCDYVKFLDCLIHSPKDVEILRQSGIIVNWKSNDEGVSTIFNHICESVVGPSKRDFCYIRTFNRINKHCSQRCNRWMASLRRYYMSNPWAIIIALCAAITLLIRFFIILTYFK
ncbi:hypothetical protein LguiB_026556 [Lonicera macranthoides]